MFAGGGRFTWFSEELRRISGGASRIPQKMKYFIPNYEDANCLRNLTNFLTLFNLLGS